MPRYRLLALDIDGTLVDIHDHITPATRRALAAARAAGIQIVLATGRRYSRVLAIVQELGIDVPVVTASGSLIKRPADHVTLFRAEVPRPVLLRVVSEMVAAGYEPMLYADSFHHGFDFYIARLETACPRLEEFLRLNAGSERLLPTLADDPPHGVFALFVMGDQAPMLALEAQLQAAAPGALYTHVLRSPKYTGYMCEVAAAGVTKWSGVLRLAAQWGIAPAEICAVGDDVNDIPMIEGAGLGVAMGNATPETIVAADRVCRPLGHDGLAQVVEWLLAE
ncbi:MAG: Cof-type HAD-IIB family hydrolase [Pirellulales bacterium]|nr:Cof-type HAD-IIB family hydrolase [Pirellulales bacterium]